MKAAFGIVATALATWALAAPSSAKHHVRHERRDTHSGLWVKRGIPSSELSLPMRIGLTQSNLHQGHDWLMEVSDPDSPKYGQHYTAEEVHDLFAPSEESVAAVRAWLKSAGIAFDRVSQSANKQWLQFDAPMAEVEDLLKTRFHIYEHANTARMSIGCDEYYVKADVQPHIDYITPGIKTIEIHPRSVKKLARRMSYNGGPIISPAPRNMLAAQSDLEYCDTYITPACMRAMYNYSTSTSAYPGNELGIFEENYHEFVDSDDLNLYFSNVAPEVPNGTFPIIHAIDGAKNVNNDLVAGKEALLDFEITYPIIYPQNSVMFLTDTYYEAVPTLGLFNTFLDGIDGSYCTFAAFGEKGDNKTLDAQYPSKGFRHPLQCGVWKPTNVITLSYGLSEYNEGTPENYMQRQCLEYMKLGMQGVTFVFASDGVSSQYDCGPKNNNGKEIFNPDFPANCPYVLTAGATALTGSISQDTEQATTQFASGGGFSNFFARPSYQESAVEAYFASDAAPKYPYYSGSDVGNGLYNRSGRGYPDVSSVGQAVLNWGKKEPYLVGGTSCSAPTWGALLTRINEERLKAGKPTVGFVNPILYKNPHVLHDITVGNNPGCKTKGFSAGKGWDPLTGLGTPNYPALLELFMKAP